MSTGTAGKPSILIASEESTSGWFELVGCREILEARSPGQVATLLDSVESGVAKGLHAVGFLTYEASPALDPTLTTRPPSELPLAWFGLFDAAQPATPPPRPTDSPSQWRPTVSPEAYEGTLRVLRQLIERGETYQVNYTFRLRARYDGDPEELFGALVAAQPARYSAYIDLGRHVLASVSPELFFELDGERIRCRPMKGTADRGLDLESDRRQRAWLAASEKNRAENLMIVDMVRNDLGRIARPGSVETTELFAVETYPTLLQMTSTVEAETDASLGRILAALFPSASITGAPKRRTMELIARLESDPRGIYTGTIAYLAPGRSARLSVAIRTLHLDRDQGIAEYGTGGGITWDSDSCSERLEAITKARVLVTEPHHFDLFETIRWTAEAGYLLLDRHLDRLQSSARYFGFRCDREALERVLTEAARQDEGRGRRVRLILERGGDHRIEIAPLDSDGTTSIQLERPPERGPIWRVGIAASAVDKNDVRLFHKTTDRRAYDAALAGRDELDDVLLWNSEGEVTESTLANLVYRIGERWFTPPLSAGLLAGTLRRELLERGRLEERTLHLRTLGEAEELCLINSVRGWIAIELVD